MSNKFLIVLSAPSGCGKTSLANLILQKRKDIKKSISYTTRNKRAGEIDGKDYFFVSKKKFEEMREKGEFLEYAKVFDHYYGTSVKFLEKEIKNHHLLLVIDVQGAIKVKRKKNALLIFLKPPSMKELKKRLLKRDTESSEEIKKRLEMAKKEIKMSFFYNYVIINDDLKHVYDRFCSILSKEEERNELFYQ